MVKFSRIMHRLILLVGLAVILSCSERERTNPFDPANTIEAPIQLSMKPFPERIELQWSYPPLEGVVETHIYRAVDDSTDYELYQVLDSDVRSFTDTQVSNYHWYYYRVSLSNGVRETSPSNAVRTFLGPTTTWMLSENGFQVLQLSYDLRHVLSTYNTFYPDNDWDVKLASFSIWLVSKSFTAVSRLSIKAGEEVFIFTQGFKSPIAVVGEGTGNNFYVLDNGQNNVQYFQEEQVTREYIFPSGNYISLHVFTNQNRLVAINTSTLYLADLSLNRIVDSLAAPPNMEFTRSVQQGIWLFAIANDFEANRSIIFYRSMAENDWQQLPLPMAVGTLAYSFEENAFVVSKIILNGPLVFKDNLVKLSADGSRLWELTGFSVISDLKINRTDQTVVLCDRLNDRLVMVDKHGNIAFKSREIYDPIRVHIQ